MKSIIAAVTVAILATGCAGFKDTPLVGYQAGPGLPAITYERATAKADFDACRVATKDGTVDVVLVPDTIASAQKRRLYNAVAKNDNIRRCMSAKGHTELVVVQ